MSDFATSLALTSKFFELIRSGRKTVEIRKRIGGLKAGEVIRLMRGYNPKYGSLLKRVRKIERAHPSEVSDEILSLARVSRGWLEEYAQNKPVFLIFLSG